MADAFISLEEAEQFLAGCKDFSQRIEAAVVALRNSRDRVGESWRDRDFETISGMIDDITRAAAASQQTADEEIIPHVERKVAVLGGKVQ